MITRIVYFKVVITEMYPRIPWELVEDPLGSAEHILGTSDLKCLMYMEIECRQDSLQKLTVAQQPIQFPASYGARSFITVLRRSATGP